MSLVPDALGTAKNESGSAKNDNMITGPDASRTAENESGSAKHENGTRRPRYSRKRVRSAKKENGPDALGTA
jgi:hypothetical protein